MKINPLLIDPIQTMNFLIYFASHFYIWKAIKHLMSIKKTFKNNFAKNVLMIAGGAAFAQVISLLLSPVITRYIRQKNLVH